MKFFDTLFSFLFPDRCVGCGVPKTLLCPACMQKIPPAVSPEKKFVTSIFTYADFRIRRLLKLLKYMHAARVADVFGAQLGQALGEFLGEESLFISARPVLLVPIPLSKKRQRVRGYNQAELLARAALAELAPGPLDISLETNLLKKVRDTESQARITKRSERLRNLDGCFIATEHVMPVGQVVILIDDVTTTGATLSAARQTLLRAGFTMVYALTVAH